MLRRLCTRRLATVMSGQLRHGSDHAHGPMMPVRKIDISLIGLMLGSSSNHKKHFFLKCIVCYFIIIASDKLETYSHACIFSHLPIQPFARLRPPSNKIPEEIELIWDDSVAPETCIDIDAPHVSSQEVVGAFLAALAFFLGLHTLVAMSDPVAANPVASRHFVIPPNVLNLSLALAVSEDEHEEQDEEEHR